ncbi:MAG: hypothetical protein KC591_14570, partial [Gemmatimonadetes bacterium]|nr:hypothetical protein [Gemmatimonadota bacterium]
PSILRAEWNRRTSSGELGTFARVNGESGQVEGRIRLETRASRGVRVAIEGERDEAGDTEARLRVYRTGVRARLRGEWILARDRPARCDGKATFPWREWNAGVSVRWERGRAPTGDLLVSRSFALTARAAASTIAAD